MELAKAMWQRVDHFESQDLATMAWSFAKVDQTDLQLLAALAATAQPCMEKFKSQELCTILQVYLKAGQWDTQFMRLVINALKLRASECTSVDIYSMAWQFALAARSDRLLFMGLAKAALQRCANGCCKREFVRAAHAFSKSGQIDRQTCSELTEVA
eukprot:gnl/MRDRNA2_/MRDRNA2_272165_c0_seq1.p1 gnl/MRDRNA2_/MRDRNA2_272165_c0~~gnl/MRDRNA2_/MRDRNA2_272165_c0_seq1.p1  ORF type:complete len:157 (+),score=30.80 gnl/MRDRNA2_/MRDRNA2_272165_c0_seq1:289-759(+)